MSAAHSSRPQRSRPRAHRLAPAPAVALPVLLVLLVLLVLWALAGPAALAADKGSNPKPDEDQLRHDGYRFAGEKFEDKFPELPGEETNIRIFKKGQETLGLYILPSGQVYGFAVKVGSQPLTAFIDEYNTGFCQKDYGDGESFRIDFASYRLEPGYASGRKRSLQKK